MRRLGLGALLLAAFAARLHHLDFESFWIDEADALRLALAPPSELISRLTQVGENGPLYFIILRGWLTLTGTSEFALRYLSLVAGVLTVALFWVLGKRLGKGSGTVAGAAAATLAAGSSYLMFYSQETKMYALVALLSALSGYALARGLDTGRGRWFLVFLVATSLALYTHVFSALLILGGGAYCLLRLRDGLQRWRWVGASFGALTLPYLPLAAWQLWALSLPRPPVGSFYGAPDFLDLLRLLLTRFSTQQFNVERWQAWLVFGGLAALGLAGAMKGGGSRRLAFFAIAFFVVPVIAAAALFSRMPIFLERYLTPTLPALFMAFAGSAVVLTRFRRYAALIPVGLILAYNAPPFIDARVLNVLLKEHWRAAAEHLEPRLQEGDITLFISSDAAIAFDYYVKSHYRKAGAPEAGLGTRYDEAMRRTVQGATRAWVVLAQYGQNDAEAAEAWLTRNATKTDQVGFRDVVVQSWQLRPPTSEGAQGDVARFDELTLIRASLPSPQPACSPISGRCLLRLQSDWRVTRPVDEEIRVSTRLVDSQGRVWSQFDLAPSPYYPMDEWAVGRQYADDRYLSVPSGLPAGGYAVVAFAFRAESGIPIAGPAGGVVLARTGLAPPPGGWPKLPTIGVLGGLTVHAATVWNASAQGGERIDVSVAATNGGATPIGIEARLDDPASAWAPLGALAQGVSTARGVLTAPRVPGTSPQRVLVRAVQGGGPVFLSWPLWRLPAQSLDVGAVRIQATPPNLAAPTAGLRPLATFGGGLELQSAVVRRDGGTVQLPLDTQRGGGPLTILAEWRAAGPLPDDARAFVHLTDAAGRPLAQQDVRPGTAPAFAWVSGEVLASRHELALAGIPPGSYELRVGVYSVGNGTRLPLPSGADHVVLGRITLR